MSNNTMRYISIMPYLSDMGEISFPSGFEEHLKKLANEYEDNSLNHEADRLIWDESKEFHFQSIPAQMRCFGWSERERPVEWDDPRLVSENPDPELQEIIHPLMMEKDERRLIVKEKIIVGVALSSTIGLFNSGDHCYQLMEDHCILPYHGYVSSSSSDNNGSGYKTRDWYTYLICLPYNHNLW